jgi:hypothetical protein
MSSRIRSATDAVRIITKRLKIKEMGPGDYIRTKHVVKTFVEGAGDLNAAEELLMRARIRREVTQNISMNISQEHGERITD